MFGSKETQAWGVLRKEKSLGRPLDVELNFQWKSSWAWKCLPKLNGQIMNDLMGRSRVLIFVFQQIIYMNCWLRQNVIKSTYINLTTMIAWKNEETRANLKGRFAKALTQNEWSFLPNANHLQDYNTSQIGKKCLYKAMWYKMWFIWSFHFDPMTFHSNATETTWKYISLLAQEIEKLQAENTHRWRHTRRNMGEKITDIIHWWLI